MKSHKENKFICNKISYKMINISDKNLSYRRACVMGSIHVGKTVLQLIKEKRIEKGDPLVLAEIAGINAAKKTSDLILLCHQINIESITVNVMLDEEQYNINIYCMVFAYAKTGVEMEAMCGVSAGLLTIYDLTKKLNPFTNIKNINLLFKDGGENGLIIGSINNIPPHLREIFLNNKIIFNNVKIIIITLSDRSSKGSYEDISGQIILDFFKIRNAQILNKIIIPDDINILDNIVVNLTKKYSPNLIISTGSTGITKNDISNKVFSKLCHKEIPGIPEFLRLNGSNYSITSWLSSSFAGIYKSSILVSLPGNPSGVFESLNVLEMLFLHSIEQLTKQ